MTKIIVLFNLKPNVSRQEYEAWARQTDLPIVRALPGVDSFDVLRTTGLLGADASAPFQYIEILNVGDLEAFQGAVASETMQRVADEFQALADNPIFITTEDL
jgi:hypothetical protein